MGKSGTLLKIKVAPSWLSDMRNKREVEVEVEYKQEFVTIFPIPEENQKAFNFETRQPRMLKWTVGRHEYAYTIEHTEDEMFWAVEYLVIGRSQKMKDRHKTWPLAMTRKIIRACRFKRRKTASKRAYKWYVRACEQAKRPSEEQELIEEGGSEFGD